MASVTAVGTVKKNLHRVASNGEMAVITNVSLTESKLC